MNDTPIDTREKAEYIVKHMDDYDLNACETAQAYLELLQAYLNPWIERSKRNPKERGEYLVYRAEVYQIDFANFGTSKGWDNGRYTKDNPYRVTHWMPLPNPPKDSA